VPVPLDSSVWNMGWLKQPPHQHHTTRCRTGAQQLLARRNNMRRPSTAAGSDRAQSSKVPTSEQAAFRHSCTVKSKGMVNRSMWVKTCTEACTASVCTAPACPPHSVEHPTTHQWRACLPDQKHSKHLKGPPQPASWYSHPVPLRPCQLTLCQVRHKARGRGVGLHTSYPGQLPALG
jgi:hypothetical protein